MLKNKFITFFFLLIITPLEIFAIDYTCTITANNAAFGNFNPLNYTASTSTTTFNVRCTATAFTSISGTITFSKGNSNSFTSRTMKSNTNSLSYNLYKDSACTQVLGDGTGGTYTYTLSGTLIPGINNSMNATVTLYGKIPSQPTATVGSYTDNIIITLTYQ